MKRPSAFLLVLVLFLPANLSAQVAGYVIPQFAIGGDYEALLFVANKTEDTVGVEVFLRQGNAALWSAPWMLDRVPQSGSEFTFRLGPKQTRKLILSGNDEVRAGYLNIIATEGTWGKLAVSFFYNVALHGTLIDSIGVPPAHVRSTVLITGRDIFTYKYTAAVAIAPGVSTGIAITHGLRDPVSPNGRIRFTLYNEQGDPIRIQTWDNDGHRAIFVRQIWTDLPSSFVGMLQAEPTHKDTIFYMTVLRLEHTADGFQLTSTPPDTINELAFGGACILEEIAEIW